MTQRLTGGAFEDSWETRQLSALNFRIPAQINFSSLLYYAALQRLSLYNADCRTTALNLFLINGSLINPLSIRHKYFWKDKVYFFLKIQSMGKNNTNNTLKLENKKVP